MDDRPADLDEVAYIFGPEFDPLRIADAEHRDEHQVAVGGLEVLTAYGTHQSERSGEYTAVVFLDAPILRACNLVDLPGHQHNAKDAKLAQGSWDQLFRKFNRSEADLIAHIRRTRNGMAALLPVARLSTRLIRAIRHDLARIDNRERGAPRRRIHGAFSYQLCRGRSWCATEAIPREWLAVYRAKCAWSGAKFEKDAETWFNPTSHGLLYHPVKLHAPTSGRDFKRYNCAKTFAKELSENGRQRAAAANAARGDARV